MSENIVEVFRENIRFLVDRIGISKRCLTERAELSSSVLSFDKENYNPTLKTIQTLADTLHIDWRLLFIPHSSDEWRLFMQIMNIATDYRETQIVDPETHGILGACILSKEEINACREKERQYIKRLSQVAHSPSGENQGNAESVSENSEENEENKNEPESSAEDQDGKSF
ncbi:MAG: hypothetical protein IKN64_00065 [Desulfovibrio sp.]|nr:hypothetical protein [Desulfovibrio sp.]